MSDIGPKLDRRAALAWAGALAAALGTPYYFGLDYSTPAGGIAPGYGRDPDLLNPSVPWPRTLAEHQLETLRHIANFILPREGTAPAASEIGVHELIDEWVSAPYPEQAGDRKLILGGLTQLDLAARRGGKAKDFASASAELQARLLAGLEDRNAPTAAFYKRLRRLMIGAYYTTEPGFADIRYIGNKAIAAFPEPTPEVLAALDRAYTKLGL